MARKHQHYSQVVGAFVRIPEPLEDGKVRCNGCSAIVTLSRNGKIRRHKSPAGEECAYTATYAAPVHLEETPAVVIPPRASPPSGRVEIRKRARSQRPSDEAIELDARLAPRNGECVDCGRWLPGERILCSKCSRRRNEKKGLA